MRNDELRQTAEQSDMLASLLLAGFGFVFPDDDVRQHLFQPRPDSPNNVREFNLRSRVRL